MNDEPLWSVRRLFFGLGYWLMLASEGEIKVWPWEAMRWYRRPMAAARHGAKYF